MMSKVSLNKQPNMQQIDLTNLNLQQLTQLKEELNQDLRVFQNSLHTLKMAQNRLQESKSCLERITPETEGNEILVPLTGSMYVAGRMADTNNVLVEIGTGYYAQKSVEDAKDYLKRKVAYVTEHIEKIQQFAVEKNKIKEATVDVIEMKVQKQLSERQ